MGRDVDGDVRMEGLTEPGGEEAPRKPRRKGGRDWPLDGIGQVAGAYEEHKPIFATLLMGKLKVNVGRSSLTETLESFRGGKTPREIWQGRQGNRKRCGREPARAAERTGWVEAKISTDDTSEIDFNRKIPRGLGCLEE